MAVLGEDVVSGVRPVVDPSTPASGVEQPGATGAVPPPTGWGSGYRPYLDGLRAVAVYLVVLFHAGSERFGGGYVGVDVFFVLSGFLVTRLLLRDLTGTGRVGYSRFYARRFRRLLPAAFVTLTITALVFTAIASPVEVLDAVDAFKAAFLYVTNWYFIHQASGYFGADVSNNPVLHFWSLAVEEQFYLLWPLLLGGLYVLARRFGPTRRHRVLQAAVAAGAAASLTLAWTLRTSNPNHAYYGTDARAYQLLAGALLALTPGLITRLTRNPKLARTTTTVALLALLATAMYWPSLDPVQRGTAITAITVTLISALEATRGQGAGRILSTEPLVYLGKISYGTYLWHWPIIIVIVHQFHLSTISTIAITVLVATALASLSYEVLEHPIRISTLLDRHRKIVVAIGLATSITAALVLIPAITKAPTTNSAAADQTLATTGFTPVPNLDWQQLENDHPVLHNCYAKPVDSCIVVRGTGPTIMLIGDSDAAMLVPTFTAIAHQHNFTLAVTAAAGCPWQKDLYTTFFGSENCPKFKDDLYARVLPALHPDLIVDMNYGWEQPDPDLAYRTSDGSQVVGGSPREIALVERTTTDSLAAELAVAAKVVLVEPVPFASADPLTCLSRAHVVEDCRFVTSSQPTSLETLYRKLDTDNTRVWSLDMDKLVCPYLPICDPIVNSQVVRFDNRHLTSFFAQTLAPAVDTYLIQNRITPR